MTPTYYYTLWIVYALGCVAAYGVFWNFTRWPKAWWLGAFFRILVFAILVTPAAQSEDSPYMVPAWIAVVFDELQRIGDGWLRAGINLMAAIALALAIYFVYLIFSLIQRRRRKKNA